MSGGGKGGGSQTTTTSNTPWAPTGAQLNNLYSYLDPWLNGGVNPSPGPSNTPTRPTNSYTTGSYQPSTWVDNPMPPENAGQGNGYSGPMSLSSLGRWGNGLTNVPTDNGQGAYDRYNAMATAAKNRMASLDPSISAAWDMKSRMAQDPNSAYNVAANEALRTARGDYLNSNPYLDKNVNTALNQVQSRVNSQFGLAGRTGSGMNQDLMTRGMGDIASQMYGANYQNERGRQMQALGLAPQLASLAPDMMGEIGNQRMGYQQQLLDAPLNTMRQYAGLIQPGLGFGTQTSATPYHGNYGGLGSLLGMGVGYVMAPATGGASAALPYLLGGSTIGGGLGSQFGY